MKKLSPQKKLEQLNALLIAYEKKNDWMKEQIKDYRKSKANDHNEIELFFSTDRIESWQKDLARLNRELRMTIIS